MSLVFPPFNIILHPTMCAGGYHHVCRQLWFRTHGLECGCMYDEKYFVQLPQYQSKEICL